MRVRSVLLIVVSVMLLIFAIGCAKQEPPTPTPAPPPPPPAVRVPDGKTVFEMKCSVCHGIDRATSRKETKEKWADIVKQMRAKKVDWISDAEAAKIIDYLAKEHGTK